MAPLLALGLSLLAMALLPASRGGILVIFVGVEATLLMREAAADPYIVGATGIVATLAMVVVREIVSAFGLLFAPAQEARRAEERDQRDQDRELARAARERRRRERELQREEQERRLAA